MAESDISARAPTFRDEVMALTPGGESHLELCLQCGTCGGSCPSGPDMDHTPRMLFAMIAAGLREDVLRSNTPWYCVSCYYCMERCPQEIHITDIMYTLKRMAIREGYAHQSSVPDAPEFSKTFIDYIDEYGRSFEFGVAARHHLKYHPLKAISMASGLGLGMIRKGRMELTPTRIEGIDQLEAILDKARQLGEAS